MKLPLLSGRQVVRALERLGFVVAHRKGSHVKMKHSDGRLIVFPFHDEVDRFTLKGALRDAEIDVNEFTKNVRCLCGKCLVNLLTKTTTRKERQTVTSLKEATKNSKSALCSEKHI